LALIGMDEVLQSSSKFRNQVIGRRTAQGDWRSQRGTKKRMSSRSLKRASASGRKTERSIAFGIAKLLLLAATLSGCRDGVPKMVSDAAAASRPIGTKLRMMVLPLSVIEQQNVGPTTKMIR
jgi:3-polyprenyl-4-hydroxybenzoate decarboxylase